MIRKDIKNTLIYNELLNENVNYFDCKGLKFIHNIDTLYYSVFIANDSMNISNNKDIEKLISDLAVKKENVINSGKDIYFLEEDELLLTRTRFKLYEYCLRVNNMFDIFISSYLPNEVTPRIVVQLRSIGLWLDGDKKLINKSYEILNKVLAIYNLTVLKVQENRIDYAFHTNYIQNPFSYFDDNTIKNKLDTTYKIYQKVGRKNNKELTIEYLSLGDRKSNNTFLEYIIKLEKLSKSTTKDSL